jgi:hypothetical protein
MTVLNKCDPAKFPILFGRRWPARRLDLAIASVDPAAVCAEYAGLQECAPRRSAAGKLFFVGHTGLVPAAGMSNRKEEHLAIALINLKRRWPRPGGGWSSLLDYQVPLKARQADARIGKIDLLGVTDQGRLVIIELKVDGPGGGRSDSPIAALMEGLRYAAVVQAELTAIASEAERCFGTKIAMSPPIVQLLAPRAWWCAWLNLKPAGDWAPALHALATEVQTCTGVTIECMACDDGNVTYGFDGRTPQVDRVPSLYPVRLNDTPVIGAPL